MLCGRVMMSPVRFIKCVTRSHRSIHNVMISPIPCTIPVLINTSRIDCNAILEYFDAIISLLAQVRLFPQTVRERIKEHEKSSDTKKAETVCKMLAKEVKRRSFSKLCRAYKGTNEFCPRLSVKMIPAIS